MGGWLGWWEPAKQGCAHYPEQEDSELYRLKWVRRHTLCWPPEATQHVVCQSQMLLLGTATGAVRGARMPSAAAAASRVLEEWAGGGGSS